MGLTKAQLEALNDSSFPNNNAGAITPTILRDYNDAVIGNTVNQDVYSTDSASFDSRIDGLATTSSVNAISTSVGLLQTFSGSQYKADSASFSSRIEAVTGSGGTVNTGSLLVTASAAGNTITFTKGDSSTFNVSVSGGNVDTSSLVTTASFNAYTQSTNDFTASISTSVGLLQTFSASSDSRYVQNSQTSSMAVSSSTYAVTASFAVSSSLATNAKDIIVEVKNTTGAQINKGTVVRIIGAVGDNALISTASWEDDNNSANTLGFVVSNIPNDSFGTVMTQGTLLSVNTDPALGYAAGDIVFLSSSGQYTNVIPPAPYHEVRLGQVLRAQQNNGSIYVLIQNGYELTELHDVNIVSASNYDLLAYNSASAQWENKSIGTLGLATTGSNSFVGNQSIEGNLYISSSNTSDVIVNGQIFVSSSATSGATAVPKITVSGSAGTTTINRNSITTRNATNQAVLNPSFTAANIIATNDEIGFSVDPVGGGVGGWTTGPAIYVNNDAGDTYPAVFGFQDKANYTDGRVTVLTPLSASAGITSSDAFINGELYSVTSASFDSRILAITGSGGTIDTGSFATTGSNTFTGIQTFQDEALNATSLVSTSGSLMLVAKTFNSSSTHITASAGNQVNLIFKNSNNNRDTIISGSNNIFTNPPSTGIAGFKAYMGSANIMLTTGAGNDPFSFITASAQFSPTVNNNILNGGNISMRCPVSASGTWTIQRNYLGSGGFNFGTGAVTNPGINSLSCNNNIIAGGTVNFTTPFNLASGVSFIGNFVNGSPTFALNSGSIGMSQSNINGGFTFTNNASGSNILINRTNIGGNSHTITARNVGTASSYSDNIIFGQSNQVAIDVSQTNNAFNGNNILGVNLIVTASGIFGNNTYNGSLFTGRNNAVDGNKALTAQTVFAVGTGTSTTRKTGFLIDSGSNTFVEGSLNVSGSLIVTGSNFSINSNADVSGSSYYAISNAGFRYAPSSASLDNSYTRYGKDSFQIYQYQNQPYAFGVICTADQLNAYTGSQFRWGTVNSLGPIVNYMNMISASYTGSIGEGSPIPGLDYLKDGEILQIQRGATFDKNVYIQQGLYVSQSAGGSSPAITINGTGGPNALVVTGSVTIVGSTNISTTLTLGSSNPLPTGAVGMMATSASVTTPGTNELFFYDGANWRTITLV